MSTPATSTPTHTFTIPFFTKLAQSFEQRLGSAIPLIPGTGTPNYHAMHQRLHAAESNSTRKTDAYDVLIDGLARLDKTPKTPLQILETMVNSGVKLKKQNLSYIAYTEKEGESVYIPGHGRVDDLIIGDLRTDYPNDQRKECLEITLNRAGSDESFYKGEITGTEELKKADEYLTKLAA